MAMSSLAIAPKSPAILCDITATGNLSAEYDIESLPRLDVASGTSLSPEAAC
jgi:hypothetical protein